MIARHPRVLALTATMALAAMNQSAHSELPANTVVVTRAASVDAGVLPTLVRLEEGSFSSLELVEVFTPVAGQPMSTILTYTVGDPTVIALDSSLFVAPSASVRVFDPELNDTKSARSVGAGSEGEASFEVDAEVYTLSQLLASPGSALFFSVPEPEPALALAIGVAVLGWLALSRRSDSRQAAR